MKKASKMLLGKKDFKTFQASNCYSPTSVKTLKKINIKAKFKNSTKFKES